MRLKVFLRKKDWGLFVVGALVHGRLVGVKSGWMENKQEKSGKKIIEVAAWLGGE